MLKTFSEELANTPSTLPNTFTLIACALPSRSMTVLAQSPNVPAQPYFFNADKQRFENDRGGPVTFSEDGAEWQELDKTQQPFFFPLELEIDETIVGFEIGEDMRINAMICYVAMVRGGLPWDMAKDTIEALFEDGRLSGMLS